MPPKASKTQRKTAVSSSAQDICVVCCQKIGPKDEALFCSGNCQRHLHRYCASVSEQSYKTLTSDDAPPFLCYCCFRAQKDEEIAKLRSVVDILKHEIDALKSSQTKNVQWPMPTPSSKEPVTTEGPNNECGENIQSVRTAHNTVPATASTIHDHDKKINVVLYGVEECRAGLSRAARLESDLSSVVNIFSGLDSTIQHQSIKDCYRLGKFSRDAARPRPILVKFVRIADVAKIISKKKNLSTPLSVKPDMSHAQRLQESLLMRERWQLIQSGVSRKSIRLRGDCLYVSQKLHGRVSNSKFVHASTDPGAPCGLDKPNSPKSSSPVVEHQCQSVASVDNTTTSVSSDTMPVNDTCSQQNTSFNGVDTSVLTSSPLPHTGAPTQPNTGSSKF